MGFMKHFFQKHQVKEDQSIAPSIAATPVTSNAATPAGSPNGSLNNVDAISKPVSDRYHNDPMRTSKKPDTLGNFFDPMGGHHSYGVSRDVTNTGA
jgi:hypothetical protein